MENMIQQDSNLLENIKNSMKEIVPNLDAVINRITFDEDCYASYSLLLSLTGWDDGCGYLDIHVHRPSRHDRKGNLVYGDIDGIDVEFQEGDADTDEYENDKKKVRKQWLDGYIKDFLKIFGKIFRSSHLKLNFSINDT